MSWGTELWDQYDQIAVHTQKGIDFLDKYSGFLDARCKIEQEYASKLRRLSKNYLPKRKDDDEYQFTATKAFKLMLNEINDLAGQHEVIAENLSTAVVSDLNTLVKSIRDDRRKHLQEGARIQQQLTVSLSALAKTKEKYEKAFGASERALEAYNKADADMNLSRADVDKYRMSSNIKRQQMDDSKNEYANQLQKTNELQRQYYSTLLPGVFTGLQDLEEKRIKCIQNYMRKSAAIEQDVLPIVTQCLEGIQKCTDSINEKEDSQIVIEKYKSGFLPPTDYPFEDLSTMDSSNQSLSSTPISTPSEKKLSILGTITGGKIRKRSGLLGIFTQTKEDFSELPPNQRRKKLISKLDELTAKISQETAARDGLMKMKTVYEANPALGDPMSIQGQLTENGQRLDKLRSELRKFQGWLEDCEGRAAPGSPASSISTRRNGNSPRRSSVSDEVESLSRSASDSSVNHNKNSLTSQGLTGSTMTLTGTGPGITKVTCRLVSPLAKTRSTENLLVEGPSRSSHSPESGIGTSAQSLGNQDTDIQDIDDDEFYDVEPLPILGKCRGLYTFEASSEGSVSLEEGEELWLIETDQGDGWTRVRRLNPTSVDPMPEGFVPTSYLEIYDMFAQPQPV
ncbi:formin-binding protein 1-like [Eurytemora carolleeae]|uniref:formin-binding protein 1-like n=1 Tax=Eurytemora carolleeae TaxID=1294199 RepID=UPI000C761006|nr:formin-binding protein 1-like [Eurytemora carolleeae]|eukprot:XP_023341734.1 formin-binding protein 1-like [Eurytemora affinis]